MIRAMIVKVVSNDSRQNRTKKVSDRSIEADFKRFGHARSNAPRQFRKWLLSAILKPRAVHEECPDSLSGWKTTFVCGRMWICYLKSVFKEGEFGDVFSSVSLGNARVKAETPLPSSRMEAINCAMCLAELGCCC